MAFEQLSVSEQLTPKGRELSSATVGVQGAEI